MQLTIDSTETLESVLAVLSSVYQVQLSAAPRSDAPSTAALAATPAAKKGTRAAGRAGKSPTAAGGSRRGRSTSPAAVDASAVRAWAQEHDLAVNGRGRIPASLVNAYRDAHT